MLTEILMAIAAALVAWAVYNLMLKVTAWPINKLFYPSVGSYTFWTWVNIILSALAVLAIAMFVGIPEVLYAPVVIGVMIGVLITR